MDDTEHKARIECAAVHRLIGLYGWDDPFFAKVSVRAPGEGEAFLVAPPGRFFEEVTASSLVEISSSDVLDGDALDAEGRIRPFAPDAAATHAAIYRARPDISCIIALQTPALVGVASQGPGLLPITQNALLVSGRLGYCDAIGISSNNDLISVLSENKLVLMRHHGALVVGLHPADAFVEMFFLERACAQQIAALNGSTAGALAPDLDVQHATAMLPGGKGHMAAMAWPALLRKLDRDLPGYDL